MAEERCSETLMFAFETPFQSEKNGINNGIAQRQTKSGQSVPANSLKDHLGAEYYDSTYQDCIVPEEALHKTQWLPHQFTIVFGPYQGDFNIPALVMAAGRPAPVLWCAP
jgi:hypothetical protein